MAENQQTQAPESPPGPTPTGPTNLRDDLASQMEGLDTSTGGSLEPLQNTKAPPQPELEGAGRPSDQRLPARDADGRFISAEEAARQQGKQGQTTTMVDAQGQPVDPTKQGQPEGQQQAQGEQQPPAEGQGQQSPADLQIPPSTWRAAAKAEWSRLPENVRAEIKKRETDMVKGFEEVGQKARFADSVIAEVQPYAAMIQSEGGTPQTAIRQLLSTAYRLRTGTPQERGQLVMAIAQQYGADLTPWQGGAQPGMQQQGQFDSQLQQYINSLVTPLQQRLQQYEQLQQQSQQTSEQQQQQEAIAAMEAFRSATNADGTLKHTYFEDVRGVMAGLLTGGVAQTLEQAYDMACNALPEVRNALSAEQRNRDEAKRLEEAKRQADAARRASAANVEATGATGIVGGQSMSLRDELASQLPD